MINRDWLMIFKFHILCESRLKMVLGLQVKKSEIFGLLNKVLHSAVSLTGIVC